MRQRGVTVARRALLRDVLAAATEIAAEDERADPEPRPATRGECQGGLRPCPWVGCRHHLYLDVNPESGAIKFNFKDLEPWELSPSCSLDIADRGASTLDEVGRAFGITREGARQNEERALAHARRIAPRECPDEEEP